MGIHPDGFLFDQFFYSVKAMYLAPVVQGSGEGCRRSFEKVMLAKVKLRYFFNFDHRCEGNKNLTTVMQ
ncbi:MAG: hypothetical protein JXR22_07025 [Prolixibacteraceae bacterium]|nr:hypothetical protein [Prolixibacteraceae bacterium]